MERYYNKNILITKSVTVIKLQKTASIIIIAIKLVILAINIIIGKHIIRIDNTVNIIIMIIIKIAIKHYSKKL